MKIIKFTIELVTNPIPHQNNVKYTTKGAYKKPKLAHYQYHVGLMAREAMIKSKCEMFECDVSMDVIFYCKDKRNADRTNMLKSFEDALQNICYVNDKQVKAGNTLVKYDKLNPRIEVSIKPLNNER